MTAADYLDRLYVGLSMLYRNADSIDLYKVQQSVVVNIHSKTEPVHLRFADMPRIADLFGTENLNFRAEAGDLVCDSVTYEGGTVLTITAKVNW